MTQSVETYCKIKLLTPSAQVPVRGSDRSAGLDAFADFFDENGEVRQLFDGRSHHDLSVDTQSGKPFYRLMPGCRIMIPLGVAFATSDDLYPRVAPRSGLALKNGIQILGGVVDADYRGEINAILHLTDPDFHFDIHHGARIAQLVLEKVWIGQAQHVQDLDLQGRGADGFGSTGV